MADSDITQPVVVLRAGPMPSHYIGLEYLLRKNGITLKYFEYNIFRQAIDLIKGRNFVLFRNIVFLLGLLVGRKKKIVLGIAPYDKNLRWLNFFLSRHVVYYHTSHAFWDGSRMPCPTKSIKYQNFWKKFITETVRHVFAVSEASKDSLINNGYSTDEKISVVNHAMPFEIKRSDIERRKNSFLYVGRLSPEKGLLELCEFFQRNPNLSFTIIGDGKERRMIESYAARCKNIIYNGAINNFEELITYYLSHDVLLLNSKKTSGGEELFGMTIFEAMAYGCIPIAINHVGPREIIANLHNGILCDEGSIIDGIGIFLKMTEEQRSDLRQNALKRGQDFQPSVIANRWTQILK
ncbi:MAG: glycosyltransferase family 4 protein [Muribaculaceae bacterium]|nr:glycosyltransferase family 4 protein [Muribaculaceae bacterium]